MVESEFSPAYHKFHTFHFKFEWYGNESFVDLAPWKWKVKLGFIGDVSGTSLPQSSIEYKIV